MLQITTVSRDVEVEGNVPRPLRKRLLRISLRMVFVLTTILCVWLGFKVHQVKQQREAVAWVEAHGGMVAYQHEKIPHGPKWLRDLIGVDYFVKPFRVTLDSDHPESLSQLAKLPELTKVEVFANPSGMCRLWQNCGT